MIVTSLLAGLHAQRERNVRKNCFLSGLRAGGIFIIKPAHGTCGAGVGECIACSVLTGATPLAKEEWRLSNLMTAACLTAIGKAGGPAAASGTPSLLCLPFRSRPFWP